MKNHKTFNVPSTTGPLFPFPEISNPSFWLQYNTVKATSFLLLFFLLLQCCTPPYFKKLGGVFPKYAAAAAYAGVESSELFQIFVPCTRFAILYTGWAKSQFTYVGLNSSVTDCSIEIILSGMTYYHHWFEEFVKSKHIRVHFFQMKVHFRIYLIVPSAKQQPRTSRYSVPSAKQQPSNIKHGGAIRPNVCKLTFGPPCIFVKSKFWQLIRTIFNVLDNRFMIIVSKTFSLK